MGRLPLQFSGKSVTFRVPFNVAAELAVGPSQSGVTFADSSFLVSQEKPFEVHRIIIRLTAQGTPSGYSSAVTLEPQPSTMDERVHLNILDFSKNEKLTKSTTLVSTLLNKATGTWEFEEPYTLVRSEGFQISVDTLDFPLDIVTDSNGQPQVVTVQFVNVEINLQGFLLVVAPPSEIR
jgi:hypothetical protein